MAKKKFSVDVRIEKTLEIEIDDDGTMELGDLVHEEAESECFGYNRHEDDFEVMSYRAL